MTLAPGLHFHRLDEMCNDDCHPVPGVDFAASAIPEDCRCCLCVNYDDPVNNYGASKAAVAVLKASNPPRHEPLNHRQAAREPRKAVTPYRKAKQRARYVLEDFSDAECRKILDRLIELAPEVACSAICDYWEESIEQGRTPARKRGSVDPY